LLSAFVHPNHLEISKIMGLLSFDALL
jgi:hypothetical protein